MVAKKEQQIHGYGYLPKAAARPHDVKSSEKLFEYTQEVEKLEKGHQVHHDRARRRPAIRP